MYDVIILSVFMPDAELLLILKAVEKNSNTFYSGVLQWSKKGM